MAEQKWFVLRGAKEEGPFTSRQLKQMAADGRLRPEDLVRREDVETSRPARAIKGLFPGEGAENSARASTASTSRSSPASQRPLPSGGASEKEQGGTKRRWVIPSVVAAAVMLTCCGGFGVVGFFGVRMKDAAQREVADADALWERGEKGLAVDKYRGRLGANSTFLKAEDKPRVYGRVVDYDVERGDVASATAVLAEAVKDKVTPQVSHPQARAMLVAEVARVSATENRAVPTHDRNKYIADVEASTSVPVTAFAEDEYKHDFSGDDYDTIPTGAKRETRKRVIKGGAEGLSGKQETMAGYVTGAGQFIEHGAYTTWADEGETKKLREGKMLNGKQHGLTTFYYASGKKRWETVYVNDKKHGVARSWYESGQQEDENPSSNGLTHGRFRQWHESGEPKADETWVRGKEHGLHKKWWKGGFLAFVGCFREGKRYGKLFSWNEDGSAAESGEWDGDRPKGRCRLAFKGGDQTYYFVEADDGEWKGGTTAEFIARMYYFSLKDRPGVQLQFDPRARVANYYSASTPEFVGRFGTPSQDAPDFEKAPANAPPRIRDQYRRWTYRCRDGAITLSAQPTQSGSLLVTVRP